VILNFSLDVPITEHASNESLWYRYADNILYLGQSVSEGRQMLTRVEQLLQPHGLSLKEDKVLADLDAGAEAHLLGFTLCLQDERLLYGIAPAAYDVLRQHMSDAHAEADPPGAARQSLLGWIDNLGPAFASGDVAAVLTIATEYGFREISRKDVRERGEGAAWRWQRCRQRCWQRRAGRPAASACGSAAAKSRV